MKRAPSRIAHWPRPESRYRRGAALLLGICVSSPSWRLPSYNHACLIEKFQVAPARPQRAMWISSADRDHWLPGASAGARARLEEPPYPAPLKVALLNYDA